MGHARLMLGYALGAAMKALRSLGPVCLLQVSSLLLLFYGLKRAECSMSRVSRRSSDK